MRLKTISITWLILMFGLLIFVIWYGIYYMYYSKVMPSNNEMTSDVCFRSGGEWRWESGTYGGGDYFCTCHKQLMTWGPSIKEGSFARCR